ncbi:MAG: PH domain-containing protein [Patescibacteria group bacterium]|nr:PH domain-containing protein [Patescibacteria group bacterium]
MKEKPHLPMITPDHEQHLGEKAYLLMVSRRMAPGLVVMLAAAALLAASGPAVGFLAGLMAAAGADQKSAIASLSSYAMALDLGLLILGLAICLIGAVIARWEYRNYSFSFEEFDLKMRRGIVSRRIESVPYRQIQDVDIDRSLLHQALGLSKVTILTAGHEESGEKGKAEVVLDPLDKDAAEEIRALLERKIGVQIVKTVEEADAEVTPTPR